MTSSHNFYVLLDGLPANEHIIFKLICSVSQKSKGRDNHFYFLSENDSKRPDIVIKDITNKCSSPYMGIVEAYVGNDASSDENIILRPLIATRVLTTLDKIIGNTDLQSETKIDHNDKEETLSKEQPSIEFDITEEEASELAIVHDETLSNPANKPVTEDVQQDRSSVIPLKKAATTDKTLPNALVVDDSPSVRKQMELELDLFEADVDYAATAEEALGLLSQNNYDIAFLDVVLPDKDGFQICKNIKANSEDTVVIMLTGKATQSDKIKGSLAGCDDYLVKPVGRNTFQNATGKYLALKTRESYAGI